MSTVRTIAFNSWVVFVGRLISKFIGFITLILLARYLGVELFGQYSLVLAYVGLFLYLNDLGVSFVLVRKISQENKNLEELVSTVLTLKIFFSIVAIILSISFAIILGYPAEILILLFVFSMTIVPSSITAIFNGVFQAKLKNQYAIFSEIVNYAFYLLLIIVLIFLKSNLLNIFLAFLLATIAAFLTSWFFVKKYVKIRFAIDFKLWKSLFLEGYPFAFTMISSSIYSRIDVLMISKMLNDAAVGLYSAGFRLTESLAIIPNSFVLPLFPLMSNMFKTSERNLEISYKLGFKYLATVFLPISVGGTILAQRIISLIYGQDFVTQTAVLSFLILIWGAFVMFINQISITTLNSVMKEKVVMKSLVFGIVANVLLNFFLIPIYGILGAAITTLFTEIILFFVFYFNLKKIVSIEFGWLVKPIISVIVMAVVVWLFFSQNIFILVFLGGIIYFVVLFFIKGFTQQDKEIFLKILNIKK